MAASAAGFCLSSAAAGLDATRETRSCSMDVQTNQKKNPMAVASVSEPTFVLKYLMC